MPLIQVRDFATRQTPTHVYLTVVWPTLITAKTADVYANDLYVKVYNAPHLFEFDLAYPIDDTNATCTIDDDQRTIVLALPKLLSDDNKQDWDTIQFLASADLSRSECMRMLRDRRDDARARHLKRQEEARKKRDEAKWEHQRYLVRQQMDVERVERERLEQAKKLERETAENAVFEWVDSAKDNPAGVPVADRSSCNDVTQTAPVPAVEPRDEPLAEDDESSDEDDEEILALREKYKQIKLHQAQGLPLPVTLNPAVASATLQGAEVPTPRQRGEITIKFTPRQFVSAARETQDAKWAAQMEEARRRQRPGDAEAVKLEEKAIKLQSDGQCLLAVDAYSALIALTPKNHRAYVGRCECYANLNYLDLAKADARTAVALIEEMEREHQITGVYDTAKAQLRMRIQQASRPDSDKRDLEASAERGEDEVNTDEAVPLHAAG